MSSFRHDQYYENLVSEQSSIANRNIPESIKIFDTTIEFIQEPYMNYPIEYFASLYYDALFRVPFKYYDFSSGISIETLQSIADGIVRQHSKPIINNFNATLQEKIMGRFFNPKCLLPLDENSMSIREELFGLYSHLATRKMKDHMETIYEACVNIEVMSGVSGEGKTFKMLLRSVQQDFLLIYMNLDPMMIDPCFNLLRKRIESLRTDVSKNIVVFNEIQIFIMTRLLYLLSLLKIHPQLTPTQFLEYQFDGGQLNCSYIYAEILRKIYPWETITNSLREFNYFLISHIKKVYKKNVGFGLDGFNENLKVFDCSKCEFRSLRDFLVKEINLLSPIYIGIIGNYELYSEQCYCPLGTGKFRYLENFFVDDVHKDNIQSILDLVIEGSNDVIKELSENNLLDQLYGRKGILFSFIKNLIALQNVKRAALVTIEKNFEFQ